MLGKNVVSISKVKAFVIIGLVIVAAITAGYFYYIQAHVYSPSSQASTPSASPTPFPSASPNSASPSASPASSILTPTPSTTSQPTAAPTQTPSPTPTPPGYYFSSLSINPSEPWPGNSISITAQVSNYQSNGSTSATLQINGVTLSTQTIQIPNGASETINFTTTETGIGTYNIQLGTLTGSFNVVPNGEHTLSINTPYPNIPFTLDGQSETTEFSQPVSVGNHVVVMQTQVNTYTFQYWEDDRDNNPTRAVNVAGPITLAARYTGTSGTGRGSCPFLYTWNGTEYNYAADVSDGTGWLGYLEYFNPDGSMVYSYNYPYDYIKLDSTQTQPLNGFYNMQIVENNDEIFYLDSVKMIAVDHPASTDVFSTKSTFVYNLSNQGTLYTVSKNLATPVSAINGKRQNVLPLIAKMDGNFATATRWTWNNITLNLGNLAGAQDIKLVVGATISWPTTQAGGENFMKYASEPGVMPSPPPYMEVKAQNGSWVKVPNDREFPLPATSDQVFVVNLTGLFPTKDYELRINYYQDIQFDYIGVDTSPQQNIVVHNIMPSSATLKQAFSATSTSSGAFTRFGDVTGLLQSADDKFVIGREGDAVSVQFSTALPPLPLNWVRDYFFVASCWFKEPGLSYVPYTVAPLPFQAMTSFPYPKNETYPYDSNHQAYLQAFDTRIINAP